MLRAKVLASSVLVLVACLSGGCLHYEATPAPQRKPTAEKHINPNKLNDAPRADASRRSGAAAKDFGEDALVRKGYFDQ